MYLACSYFVVVFNDTATTEIYTLSLHDALPISREFRAQPDPSRSSFARRLRPRRGYRTDGLRSTRRTLRSKSARLDRDRKSTRLNSSHANISYAVFCLKKKKHEQQ